MVAVAMIALLRCAAAIGQDMHPATQPATQPAGFEVREWVVFVEDASQDQLNPDGVGTSPMPGFVGNRRHADAGNGNDVPVAPATVGVIRLFGTSDSKVDVRIALPGGSFLAFWPQGEKRDTQILWRDLTLADNLTGHGEPPEAGDWFGDLRKTPSDVLLLGDNPPERFLLYDVTIPYPSPIQVKAAGPFSFEVANKSQAPLHDLMLLKSAGDGHWLEANIGELAVASGRPRRSAAPSTSPASQLSPTTAPTTQPRSSVSATLTPSSTMERKVLSDAWRPELLKAGVSESDCKVIAQFMAHLVFPAGRMVAIYRMDDAELDRLLPMEVVPQPSKITRIAVVIIRNADPGMMKDIDALIAQLGDPDWSKRQAATKALANIGPAARPRLQAALRNKDPEVAWRAERLLAPNPQSTNSN
jgi:hypothetical protein